MSRTDSTTALPDAVEALVTAGSAAGLDAGEVRDEARRLAAAVSESATGAPQAWLAATGVEGDGLSPFFEAAASARRWRGAPTDLLARLVASGSPEAAAYATALTVVVSAASDLGSASMGVLAAAQATAAAQLAAVRGAVSGVDASRPSDGRTDAGLGAARPQPSSPEELADLGALADAALFQAARIRSLGTGLESGGLDPSRSADQHGSHPGRPVDAPSGGAPGAPGGTQAAADPNGPAAVAEEELEPERPIEELLAELDALIGLERVKKEIHRQTQLLRIDKLRTEAGLQTPTLTRHLVFLGNPGTGKTTVARLVAGIYRSLGILSKGHLVEVDRSELVAGYLGQTATKTAEVIASARGGVLFIDEAYGLALDQYGAEAITTLVKDMEDHRGDLVVIVAGYPAPMASFMETNPGMASRFSTTITFEDYTVAELRAIFERLASKSDFDPTEAALARFDEIVAAEPRGEGFGNGRYARNVLDAAIARHAWRLRDVEEPTLAELRELVPEDLAEEPAPLTAPEGYVTDPDAEPAPDFGSRPAHDGTGSTPGPTSGSEPVDGEDGTDVGGAPHDGEHTPTGEESA